MTITKQICLAIALNAAILTLGISRVHGQQGGTPREGDTPKTRSGKVSSHSSTPPRVAHPARLADRTAVHSSALIDCSRNGGFVSRTTTDKRRRRDATTQNVTRTNFDYHLEFLDPNVRFRYTRRLAVVAKCRPFFAATHEKQEF